MRRIVLVLLAVLAAVYVWNASWLAPASKDPGTTGIDEIAQLSMIPEGFDGYVWTNRIEIIGPALKATGTD